MKEIWHESDAFAGAILRFHDRSGYYYDDYMTAGNYGEITFSETPHIGTVIPFSCLPQLLNGAFLEEHLSHKIEVIHCFYGQHINFIH